GALPRCVALRLAGGLVPWDALRVGRFPAATVPVLADQRRAASSAETVRSSRFDLEAAGPGNTRRPPPCWPSPPRRTTGRPVRRRWLHHSRPLMVATFAAASAQRPL